MTTELEWGRADTTAWLPSGTGNVIVSGILEADRHRMWGNRTIRGTRVPLFRIIELYDAGYTVEEIGDQIYPHVGVQRVEAALREAGYDFLNTLDNPILAAAS